jgi:hypothetical protein
VVLGTVVVTLGTVAGGVVAGGVVTVGDVDAAGAGAEVVGAARRLASRLAGLPQPEASTRRAAARHTAIGIAGRDLLLLIAIMPGATRTFFARPALTLAFLAALSRIRPGVRDGGPGG